MSSNLRLRLEARCAQYFYNQPTSPTTLQMPKLSLTQTFRVASTARDKLGMETTRADQHLRLILGHAILLDSLMVELAVADGEQEVCNDVMRDRDRGELPQHIEWLDGIPEEFEQGGF